MKEKICGFILSAIIIIMLLVAIQFVYQEIQYIEEHPCIETRTQTRCFTHQKMYRKYYGTWLLYYQRRSYMS